ncbi:MAG: ComEC/Rec2 family competence protein [Flavobacteriaceae bacterium]|nr:ComEC/Rec2 family competence protein [Flavobacteriaceae bacterium]
MQLFYYPIPKLTLGLIAGIFLSDYVALTLRTISLWTGILVVLVLLFHFETFMKKYSMGSIFLMLLFVVLGLLCATLHHPKTNKNHYSHQLQEKDDTSSVLLLKISAELNPTLYNIRYVANVLELNNQKSMGKLLISIPKDSTIAPLAIDALLHIETKPKTINLPKNPYAFSYKNYLARKGIFHQISINPQTKFAHIKGKESIKGRAAKARHYVEQKIDALNINATSRAFLKAFYLGIRNEIPEDIKTNYKNSGVLHILALSGLHVGLLLSILELLLSPLVRIRQGKKIRSGTIIIILWGFAFLTGLSPSIIRAVTMFSCFALARGLNRQSNSINTLFISAFVVLMVHPNFCFDVGFQLSYTAVLGILLIKPILDHYWQPKHLVLKPVVTLLNVSVAAQIGILPLSLFYFHQFPLLFFLTNLLVIPVLILCLWSGFFIVVFSGVEIINKPLIFGFELLVELMNKSTKWVAAFDFLIFKNITFNGVMLILSYCIITLFFVFLTKKSFRKFIYLGATIVGLQVYIFFAFLKDSKQEFIVFQKVKHTVLGFKSGTTFEIHKTTKDSVQFAFVEEYKSAEGIRRSETSDLKRLYSIDGYQLLLVDSLGIYEFRSAKIDWVLLRNSPKIHLEQLINALNPKLIIADGSNYKSFVKRWENTCVKKGVKFYDTQTNGAYIYRLD